MQFHYVSEVHSNKCNRCEQCSKWFKTNAKKTWCTTKKNLQLIWVKFWNQWQSELPHSRRTLLLNGSTATSQQAFSASSVLTPKLTSITISVSSERFVTQAKQTKKLFWGETGTPEPDGRSLPFATGPCWHAPCYGCLFLQGSQVILAPSLASWNLTNLLLQSSKPGWNPCMACCGPSISQPTIWSYCTMRASIFSQWRTHLSFSQ